MNNAFIFDMDGVLIDNEALWEIKKQQVYKKLFGAEITHKLGSTVGLNMEAILERVRAEGGVISKDAFFEEFFKLGDSVYNEAPIPDGINELADALRSKGYRIGIVSASPLSWITTVTKRLLFENDVEVIISLHERNDLNHKPDPDGYLEAMEVLDAQPATTLILEDSNTGIKAAKASGAYTIGLQQNLVDGYKQEGADAYAATMREVAAIIREH